MTQKTGIVWYLELTNAQIDEINANGWESEIGSVYLRAKNLDADGMKQALNLALYKPIAKVKAANAEQVWVAMQNITESWTANVGSGKVVEEMIRGYAKARSMDVGDVIVWNDGVEEAVDSFGFKAVEGFDSVIS